MGKIDELIAELCPDGVEYKALGEVGSIYGGLTGKTKADFGKGEGRFVSYVNVYNNSAVDYSNLTPVVINEGERQREIRTGDVLFTASSETPDDCGMSSVVLDAPAFPIYLNSFCFGWRPTDAIQLDPGYCKHIFRAEDCRKQIRKTANGVTRFNISKERIKRVQIPIPPMEIQQEIVRILDSFAELEAELEAELGARRAQYAYYRDKLLDFTERESVSWLKLGDICLIQRGASPRPIRRYITDEFDGIPWIKIGDVDPNGKYIVRTKEKITEDGAHHSRFLKAGAFVLSNSMSFGRPYILRIDGCIHDGWLSLCDFENSYLPDFLFHLIRSSYVQQYWLGKVNTGSVSNLNADIVKETPVPVPPLSEQRRIVDILDRFEAFTTSLSDGLPAEIEARRQQYEHYRDKLLDFPRKVA